MDNPLHDPSADYDPPPTQQEIARARLRRAFDATADMLGLAPLQWSNEEERVTVTASVWAGVLVLVGECLAADVNPEPF